MISINLPAGVEGGLVWFVKDFSNPSNTLASAEFGGKCKRSERRNEVSKLDRGT